MEDGDGETAHAGDTREKNISETEGSEMEMGIGGGGHGRGTDGWDGGMEGWRDGSETMDGGPKGICRNFFLRLPFGGCGFSGRVLGIGSWVWEVALGSGSGRGPALFWDDGRGDGFDARANTPPCRQAWQKGAAGANHRAASRQGWQGLVRPKRR